MTIYFGSSSILVDYCSYPPSHTITTIKNNCTANTITMAVTPHTEERSTLNASPPPQPRTHVPTPPNGETPKIMLIPFDPESDEQSERLRLTRVACGWKADKVPLWREKQRSGDMSIHWVVSLIFLFCANWFFLSLLLACFCVLDGRIDQEVKRLEWHITFLRRIANLGRSSFSGLPHRLSSDILILPLISP